MLKVTPCLHLYSSYLNTALIVEWQAMLVITIAMEKKGLKHKMTWKIIKISERNKI